MSRLTAAVVVAILGCSSPASRPVSEPVVGSAYPADDTNKPTAEPPIVVAITGVVRYDGSEQSSTLKVTKDLAACVDDGTSADDILVSSKRGLANAVVAIVEGPVPRSGEAATHSLESTKCVFGPRVQVATVGDSLVMTNNSSVLENMRAVFAEGRKTLFNIALPNQGQHITKVLKKAGHVKVLSDVHPWMTAWIYVGEHHFATVTDEHGAFSIEGLPNGSYNLFVWHERLGNQILTTVIEDGRTTALEITFN